MKVYRTVKMSNASSQPPYDNGGRILDPVSNSGPISDDVRDIFFGVNQSLICGVLSVAGIVANVINMCIFTRIGFSETINISLFSLAISDLFSLLTLLWVTICHNPFLLKTDLPFRPFEIEYMTGGWPHAYFFSVTGWITAFVTFERFLCIAKPLKVKTILTPTRVKIIIFLIFVITIASVSPTYYTNRLSWKVYKNRTVFGVTFTDDRAEIESVTFFINQVLCPIGSLGAVVFFTSALVMKLRDKARWRDKTVVTASSTDVAASNKDTRVAKMMITVSTIFIIASTPNVVLFMVLVIEPEFSIFGKYRNYCFISFSFANVLEAINSSVNIFIYYRMSSKYKSTFDHLFRRVK